ncbi:MAG: hypothetical protein K5695_14900 [Oscillospiraceae bacterium]|nr:hypothetical protein [Oscillospiraceae bacterium]
MQVINTMYRTPGGVTVEINEDLLAAGAAVQVTVRKIGNVYQAEERKQMDLEQTGQYLDRICARHMCEDCPERRLCEDWNEACEVNAG